MTIAEPSVSPLEGRDVSRESEKEGVGNGESDGGWDGVWAAVGEEEQKAKRQRRNDDGSVDRGYEEDGGEEPFGPDSDDE